MTDKIEVLPCHGSAPGFVRLVDSFGDDLSIVRSARVSYNADWRGADDGDTADKDAKLINYLWANKHTSPFESVSFTFEVKAPLFIFAQWHRHRTWKYNQISARYTQLDEGFYVPDLEQITTQSKSNKQMRTGEQNAHAYDAQLTIMTAVDAAHSYYLDLLDMGVPRELARSVLPVGSYSRMFATVDLHNLFHFLNLRLHEHSQYEIRVYAQAMLDLIRPIVPVAVAAFEEGQKRQVEYAEYLKARKEAEALASKKTGKTKGTQWITSFLTYLKQQLQ